MRVNTELTEEVKASIRNTVATLFADGQSPARRYGIDPDKIERIEMANPQLGKLGVPMTHPLG